MNLQYQRIQETCEALKLGAIGVEWGAIADKSASNESTLADFLEQVLAVETSARAVRSNDMLLKFAGLPAIKTLDEYDFKFANDTTLVAALLDRLLHHSHIVQISGESYRLKGKKSAGIVPTNIASRAMLENNETA